MQIDDGIKKLHEGIKSLFTNLGFSETEKGGLLKSAEMEFNLVRAKDSSWMHKKPGTVIGGLASRAIGRFGYTVPQREIAQYSGSTENSIRYFSRYVERILSKYGEGDAS